MSNHQDRANGASYFDLGTIDRLIKLAKKKIDEVESMSGLHHSPSLAYLEDLTTLKLGLILIEKEREYISKTKGHKNGNETESAN